MADDDDLNRYPDEQPDWRKLHQTIHRMDQSWPVLRPVVAIVINWKSWLVGVAIYAWFRSPDIIQSLDKLLGVGP